jgi:hypothetical protein
VNNLGTTARAADDAALSAHIGSCLRCFRTAADLREVPRLQKLLRQAETDTPPADPGEAFWAGFPAALGQAWDQRNQPASGRSAAPAPANTRGNLVDRFWAWLRLPVPAAMAGAACAAMVAVMVLRPGGSAVNRSLPGATAVEGVNQALEGAEALAGSIGQEDISLSPGQAAVDESVGELGEVGLSTMLDKLDRELGGTPPAAAQGVPAQEQVEVQVSEEPGLPAASDELEGLDERGLLALSAGLRESI